MDVNTPHGDGEGGARSLQGCVASARRPEDEATVPESSPVWDAYGGDGSVGGDVYKRQSL